ncbi:hypothetical protein GWK47_053033 [Chionoecetes opilio]|uniref:Uncharacterized protein n=1 Tax=Chionoecetes opilio TaxID=41210 RepID=A0A8J4Y6I5_CHIOP|nr:hypothetical protein GWK47_053033 [Chionoecetes opilio]
MSGPEEEAAAGAEDILRITSWTDGAGQPKQASFRFLAQPECKQSLPMPVFESRGAKQRRLNIVSDARFVHLLQRPRSTFLPVRIQKLVGDPKKELGVILPPVRRTASGPPYRREDWGCFRPNCRTQTSQVFMVPQVHDLPVLVPRLRARWTVLFEDRSYSQMSTPRTER